MKTIKANTSYDEWNKIKYYREFEVISELPQIENLEDLVNDKSLTSWTDEGKCIEISPVSLDCQQPNDDVWSYNFYKVVTVNIADYHNDDDEDKNIEDYLDKKYVAIQINEEEYYEN